MKTAGNENYSIISSTWCVNRSGIILSFAIPIQVMSIDEIKEFGKQFIKAIEQPYKALLDEYFYAKTETPIISATNGGEIIMLWSFQGNDNKRTREQLKQYNIDYINYN